MEMVKFANEILAGQTKKTVLGPLTDGVYIQVGMGLGFYVPLDAYNGAKRQANLTRQIQFLTVDSAGNPFSGSREDCLDCGAGAVAWVTPD